MEWAVFTECSRLSIFLLVLYVFRDEDRNNCRLLTIAFIPWFAVILVRLVFLFVK